jgi:hypothetical protein
MRVDTSLRAPEFVPNIPRVHTVALIRRQFGKGLVALIDRSGKGLRNVSKEAVKQHCVYALKLYSVFIRSIKKNRFTL